MVRRWRSISYFPILYNPPVVMMLPRSARAEMTALPKVDTKCTTPSLIPTVNGNMVLSFSTHGQQSAAKGSLTTVSRSDIRLIQHLDSSAHGLVRRWRLIGYFPIHVLPSSDTQRRRCAHRMTARIAPHAPLLTCTRSPGRTPCNGSLPSFACELRDVGASPHARQPLHA
jgi:hypothetical protein